MEILRFYLHSHYFALKKVLSVRWMMYVFIWRSICTKRVELMQRYTTNMLSYPQSPQEGINRSLVTWMNGKSGLYTYPIHQVMFVLHWAGVSQGHSSADLYCVFWHGEQRVETGNDKPKRYLGHTSRHCGSQGQWEDYTPPTYYFIYKVIGLLENTHAVLSWKVTTFSFPLALLQNFFD